MFFSFDTGEICMTNLDLLIFNVRLFAMSQLETFANSLLKVFSKFLGLLSAWSKFVSSAKIKNLRKFEELHISFI